MTAGTETAWWVEPTLEDRLAKTMEYFHGLGEEEAVKCALAPKRMVRVWKSLRENVIQRLVEASCFDRGWVPAHMEAFHAGFYGAEFDLVLAVKLIDVEQRKPVVEAPLGEDEPF